MTFVISALQILLALRGQLISVKMAKIKNSSDNVEQEEHSHIAEGSENFYKHFGNQSPLFSLAQQLALSSLLTQSRIRETIPPPTTIHTFF